MRNSCLNVDLIQCVSLLSGVESPPVFACLWSLSSAFQQCIYIYWLVWYNALATDGSQTIIQLLFTSLSGWWLYKCVYFENLSRCMFVYLYLQMLYINSNFFTRKKRFHGGTQFKTPQGLSGGSGSTQIPTPAPRSWPWLQPQRFTCSSLNEIHQLSNLTVSPPPSFYIDNAYWFPKLEFKHPLLVEAFPDHRTPRSLLHCRCPLSCSHSHKVPLPNLHLCKRSHYTSLRCPVSTWMAGTVSSTLNPAPV